MNILQDFKLAAIVFYRVRKARKTGTDEIRARAVYNVPRTPSRHAYHDTIEGCLTWKLGRDTEQAVKKIFNGLPYETQGWLVFAPKNPGEWVERARFWQQALKANLPPKMCSSVMVLFIEWYIYCLRMEKGTAGPSGG